MLKLFYSPGACSLVARIALEEAGCAYQDHLIDIGAGANRVPDYLQINPKGRVPALAVERGIVTENCAILAFVAQSFPERGLAPIGDPFAFAQFQAFNLFIAATLHPLFRLYGRISLFTGEEHAQRSVRAHVPALLFEQFAVAEEVLADGRAWVHGTFSLSDSYLAVFAGYLGNIEVGALARFPLLAAHRARVMARPASLAAVRREARAMEAV